MWRVLRRLRARLKYRRFERDLHREMEVHRAMKQEALEASGSCRRRGARLRGTLAGQRRLHA
jgi:hypothetical protein